jgi:hypothetical protein
MCEGVLDHDYIHVHASWIYSYVIQFQSSLQRILKQLYSTNLTTTSYLKHLITKKSMTYGIGIIGPGMGLAQKCGRVKHVNGI